MANAWVLRVSCNCSNLEAEVPVVYIKQHHSRTKLISSVDGPDRGAEVSLFHL